MRKIAIKSLLSLAVIGLIFTTSCKDEYTEKDALEAQQLIDFALYVFDESDANEAALSGATVVFVQGTETRTVTTDENGVAVFADAKIGSGVYKVTLEGYTSMSGTISLSTSNFRQSQFTSSIGLYNTATSSEFMATVKGRVEIEKDLTNDVTEYADGIDLLVFVDYGSETKTFTATTDVDGRYELQIPTSEQGGQYIEIRFPDLEIDQTIVFASMNGEGNGFPEDVPSVQQYPTLFTMYTGGAQNYNNFPSYTYSPVYAIVEDAPAGQTTAVVGDVYVNADGEITGVWFSNGGDYTGDADGLVNVTFTSLFGGSGATLQFDVGASIYTSLYNIYYWDSGNYTLVGGSGYPEDSYYLNRNYYESPSLYWNGSRTYGYTVYPGTTLNVNADYGTGIYREDNLD